MTSDFNTQEPSDLAGLSMYGLVESAKNGAPGAREKLLAANLGVLTAFIQKRLGDRLRERETSQDLAQSVCREVLSSLQNFEYRGAGSFRRWLLGCAENKIRKRATYWNRDRRDTGREERGRLERLASFTTPSRNMSSKESLIEIETAFSQLSEDYQQVILLARVEGQPYEEVADQMGRSVASVRNLLCRALARFSTELALQANSADRGCTRF